MKSLKYYISKYINEKRGIAHLNISTIDMFWAIFDSAKHASDEAGEEIPILIGLSEGERDFLGNKYIVNYIHNVRELENYPVFVSADHTYSVERCIEAIDNNFDLIVADFSKLDLGENIKNTKLVVDYKNKVNPEIVIEGEVGYIGSGSNIKDSMPENITHKTDPDTAKHFVNSTEVDILAIAVGNVHGIIRGGNPDLDPQATQAIRDALPNTGLVLHGASGSSNEDIISVIKSGINIVHFSSELRLAYKNALIDSINMDTLAPYKYLKPSSEEFGKVALNKIKMLSILG